MDNYFNGNCRLCLNSISSKSFENITNDTRELLDKLLELDLDKNKHVVCMICSLKVQEALKFKSMCISTSDLIISYVDNKTGSDMNLLEIYAEKNGNKELISSLHDHKVCRLCMQLIQGEFISGHEIEADVIDRSIPEVNVNIIKDPVVCKQCFDSVDAHSSFIKNCLEVEKQIVSRCGDSDSSFRVQVELPTKTEIKQENENNDDCMDGKFTIEPLKEEVGYEVKTECVHMKPDENDQSATTPSFKTVYVPSLEIRHEAQMYKCKKCDYETASVIHLARHQLKHEDLCQQLRYACERCNFRTTSKWHIKKHRWSHAVRKNIYRCSMCSFTSMYKLSARDHLLRHKNSSSNQIYKCAKCSYATIFFCYAMRHRLKHESLSKDRSQVLMYACEECDFKTNYMWHIRKHKARNHKDPLQVRMYKCDVCSYKSKFRGRWKTHLLKHKDSLQEQMYERDVKIYKRHSIKILQSKQKALPREQMYQCDKCSFSSECRINLNNHQSTHEDPPQMPVHKCNKCGFETEHEWALKIHQLQHKNPPRNEGYNFERVFKDFLDTYELSDEVPLHMCDKCEYQTKYKSRLEKHQLKHLVSSLVRMYKCKECGNESRYPIRTEYYSMVHKNASQGQMYECYYKCNYRCKYANCYKSHLLMHNYASQAQMYECDKCNYKTDSRSTFDDHQREHKGASQVKVYRTYTRHNVNVPS